MNSFFTESATFVWFHEKNLFLGPWKNGIIGHSILDFFKCIWFFASSTEQRFQLYWSLDFWNSNYHYVCYNRIWIYIRLEKICQKYKNHWQVRPHVVFLCSHHIYHICSKLLVACFDVWINLSIFQNLYFSAYRKIFAIHVKQVWKNMRKVSANNLDIIKLWCHNCKEVQSRFSPYICNSENFVKSISCSNSRHILTKKFGHQSQKLFQIPVFSKFPIFLLISVYPDCVTHKIANYLRKLPHFQAKSPNWRFLSGNAFLNM